MPISFATLGPQNKLIIMEKCPEKSIFFFHWSVLLWGRNKGPRTSFTLSTPSAKQLGFFNCGPPLYISILCNDQPDLACTRMPFWNELRSVSIETYRLQCYSAPVRRTPLQQLARNTKVGKGPGRDRYEFRSFLNPIHHGQGPKRALTFSGA